MMQKEKRYSNYAFAAIIAFVALAAMVVYFNGYVYESVDGATHVFSYQPWLLACVFGLFASIALTGWFDWRTSKSGGVFYLAAGVVFAAIVVPSVGLYNFRVDQSGFVFKNDFLLEKEFWKDEGIDVQFSDIECISLVWGTRKENSDYYVLFERADGGEASKLFVDDRVIRAATTHILMVAEERGIPIRRPINAKPSWWYAEK